MQSFSATFLVAVLSTSVLTTAAPLFQVRANNNNNNNNNNGDLQSQFSVACATVNIAGNGTFAAIALVNQMKTNDQKVTDQLSAINATLVSAITAGEEARPVCEANAVSPDPNQLESQFSTACASVDVAGSLTGTTIGLLNGVQSNDQNIASQLAALKATMSAVNTAGQFANVACAAGRALTGESNNNSNANANASSNNNANGNNSNNGSISSNSNSNSNNNSNKNNANANNAATKNSSTSTSTISKVTQTQNASGSQKTQSK